MSVRNLFVVILGLICRESLPEFFGVLGRFQPKKGFFQSSDEVPGTAVPPGFAHTGRRRPNSEKLDSLLEIIRRGLRPVAMSELEPDGNVAFKSIKGFTSFPRDRLKGFKTGFVPGGLDAGISRGTIACASLRAASSTGKSDFVTGRASYSLSLGMIFA